MSLVFMDESLVGTPQKRPTQNELEPAILAVEVKKWAAARLYVLLLPYRVRGS